MKDLSKSHGEQGRQNRKDRSALRSTFRDVLRSIEESVVVLSGRTNRSALLSFGYLILPTGLTCAGWRRNLYPQGRPEKRRHCCGGHFVGLHPVGCIASFPWARIPATYAGKLRFAMISHDFRPTRQQQQLLLYQSHHCSKIRFCMRCSTSSLAPSPRKSCPHGKSECTGALHAAKDRSSPNRGWQMYS